MRHPLIVLALGLSALLASAACQASPPSGGAQPPGKPAAAVTPGNAVVTINMDEWQLKPSLASVPGGKVSFVVANQGKVPHEVVLLQTDLAPNALVQRGDKVDEAASGHNIGEIEVESGVTEAGTFNLPPGHYVLVCNVEAHYKQGMFAAFEVAGGTAPAPVAQVGQEARKEAPAAKAPAVPGERKDIALVKAVRPTLVNTLEAAQKGDLAAARKAFAEYDAKWNGIEVYINFRSTKIYGELETDIQAKLTKLLDDPQSKSADITSTAQAMLAKYDEAIKLVEASPAISPLFDDLAAVRILRGDTIRKVGPALKSGDMATAKESFTLFRDKWADVEDLIKAYSTDAYADTEAAMAKATTAFQKDKPDARELDPLVAETVARYNFGVSLINAAARNADMARTTYTQQDVQLGAAAGAMQAELNASLPLWQAGKYQEAGDHARRASAALFDSVFGALKAKNADAALKKALDAYTALADKPGELTTVRPAHKAAVEAAAVAQQALVGQFWTDSKFKDALRQALSAR